MTRFRHTLGLIAGVLTSALLISGCGLADIPTPLTSSETVAVYDTDEMHTFTVDLDLEAFTAMMEVYATSGDKDWIAATVTIDGVAYPQAGLRLKGNSSLRAVSADSDPSQLPWLIRLDKFVDGQQHQGWTEFVVRSNSTSTALNEAVALDLLSEAGLASQEAIATSFSVNGSEPVMRLVVQHLDEAWEGQNFDTSGWLYKSESEGDWSYRGADPTSYVDVFDQETGDENLTPLIEFLEFLNDSSDEEFFAGLPDWLDVDAFATYLACQDLIGNFDDIDGPGNNSYLRWDAEHQQFTVVAWDHNLAFGASPGGMGNPGGEGQRPQRPDAGSMPPPPAMPGEFPTDLPQPGQGTAPGQPGQADMQRSNVLADRFREVPEFSVLISEAQSRLQAELIDSGRASELLAERTALLNEHPDLVATEVVTSETESIRRMLS